ncbi:hypothetical protein TWF696_009752 [Orbilia brochopaga]|uniref:Uncharacterized protein n=1 Tax=Orbilia brochopaga TaxID=3140254 RepID=A0AAV9UBG3_9PEZI
MDNFGDFIMPGQFPKEAPPQSNDDDGNTPHSSGSTVSTPRSRKWKDVVEELSEKRALRDCITSDDTDPFELAVLEAQILSLQEELSRLAMEQQDNPSFPELHQDLTLRNLTMPHSHSDYHSTSPAPTSDASRKRGYSQVDHSTEEAETRRHLVRSSAGTAVYPTPPPLPSQVFDDDDWFGAPQGHNDDWLGESQQSLVVEPRPNVSRASVPHNQPILLDGPSSRGRQDFEVIDLTADDDETPQFGGQSQYYPQGGAYRPRVKLELRNHARFLSEWASVKKEGIEAAASNLYQQMHYPVFNQGQQANFHNPIVIGDDDLQEVFAPPQWPPFNSQSGFSHPLYQPHNSVPQSLQALKVEEQAQVTKILEHLSEDAENKQPSDRLQTPPGLSVSLMEHQKIGLTWLVKQEESNNQGGILADDMGLGKTVQAIALMLHRPSTKPHRKTTLIVCPVSLMAQWQREIEQKVKHAYALNTYIYHGQQPKKFKDFNVLKGYDVILTSYGTIAGEFKKKENAKLRQLKITPKEFPFLSNESFWYRVILDESQHVKNHQTLTSRACADLQATYRICLSGTPMQNSIDDLYGAVRFLGIPRYRVHRNWTSDFSSKLRIGRELQAGAMQRLHALIKAIMLRRKKDSTIDDKPILTLPPKTIEVVHPIFSEAEQELYTSIEEKVELRVNKYIEAGAVAQHYTYILLLLLRLRQICCHPRMIKDLSVKIPDAERLRQTSNMIALMTPEVVERLKSQKFNGCPICFEVNNALKIILPCGHEVCQECLTSIINQAQANAMAAGEDARALTCPHCRGPLDSSLMIDWSVFQSVHMPELNDDLTKDLDQQLNDALGGDFSSDDEDSESEDDSSDEGPDLGGFIVDDDDVSETESEDTCDELENLLSSNSSSRPSRKKRKVKRESNDKVKFEDEDEDDLGFDSTRNTPGPSLSGQKPKIEDTDSDKLLNLSDSDSDDDDILKFLNGEEVEIRPRKKKGKGKKPVQKKVKREKKEKKPKKGKKVKKDEPKRPNTLSDDRRVALRNKRARSKYFRDLARNWTTSAKIEKVREILKTIRENDPTEKTIVFSSFTSFLDLLQIPLQRDDGIPFERYDGSMSAKDRNDSVLNFGSNPNVNVMLISLKAGNTGLNMTAASHVIIIEPWWNPFVEEQAIDRAHRIGQLRPVMVHRLIIENTVEDRIRELQDRKREIISQAMDEEARKNISKLSVRDLVYLFTGRRDG